MHAYVLNSWKTYRSISVGYTGDARDPQDITSWLSAISVKQGSIAQCDLAIENPADVLGGTSVTANASMQVRVNLGYTVEGDNLTIQTFLGDLDVRGESQQVPRTEMSLASRDYLARMMMVQADQVQEWDDPKNNKITDL